MISVAWEPLGGPAEKVDKSGPPRFEAYMMTGDLILNLSRTQQSSLLPKHNKKIDSLLLRHHHNYRNLFIMSLALDCLALSKNMKTN